MTRPQPATEAEAIETMKRAVRSRRVRIGAHARQRMDERSVTEADVLALLLAPDTATLQDNGRWRVEGIDLDSDELTAVVTFELGVSPTYDWTIVVTLF